MDKNFEKIDRIFIPIFDSNDDFLITYGQKLIHNAGAQLVLLDVFGEVKSNSSLKERIRAIEQIAPNHISLQGGTLEEGFMPSQDLMLTSLESWKKIVDDRSEWLTEIPSTLIISEGN